MRRCDAMSTRGVRGDSKRKNKREREKGMKERRYKFMFQYGQRLSGRHWRFIKPIISSKTVFGWDYYSIGAHRHAKSTIYTLSIMENSSKHLRRREDVEVKA